jgi:hypothetical protein
MRTLVRVTAGVSLSGSVVGFLIGVKSGRGPAAARLAGLVRIAVRPRRRVRTGYLPPNRLSAGLPKGSGLPPTDTMAVPRYP